MALKLLNPGLRPLGTFDLDDDDGGNLAGGEYVQLAADASGGVDGYAADVGTSGPMGPGAGGGLLAAVQWRFELASNTQENLGGLADEGVDEYGTLFGQLIGSAAGQATVVNGAVTIGPATDRASGKVTVWHAPGLYGVSGTAATAGTDGAGTNALSGSTTANDAVHAHTNGNLITATTNDQVACFVGAMGDSSLVSTTAAAAGEDAAIECYAVYLFGMAAG